MSSAGQFTKGWPYAPAPRGRRISAEERIRREHALARAPLFNDLPKRHLRAIAKVTGVTKYPDGATVIQEGSSGATFYVLLDGRAKVVRGGRTAARLAPGDFFGEISLLDSGPRTASVIAETPVLLLSLGRRDFLRILSSQPQLAVRVLHEVAARLRGSERPLVG